ERVAEGVWARAHARAGAPDPVGDDAGDAPHGETAAARVQEDSGHVASARARPTAPVVVERPEGGCTDRDDALLPPFAEHAQHGAPAIDIGPVEMDELAHPNP